MMSNDGFPPFPDFLTIYNSSQHSHRLVIPRSNYKYYPKPLPQTAVIKRPEGNFWNVKWTINKEETISFKDGWEKLVKDNDLVDRDFLLFTYDGSQSFWVRIHRNGITLMMPSPIRIQEISDDEDVAIDGGDHPMEEEDNSDNMIISLSLGSSDDVDDVYDVDDDDDDDDDDDTAISEVNKARRSSSKVQVSKTNFAASADIEKYLDDPRNPFFILTSSSSRRVLVIAKQVIRDYALKFDRTINFIGGFGELKGKIGVWTDRVVAYKWDEVDKRNNAKPGDEIICEIIRKENVVRSIKVHVVKK